MRRLILGCRPLSSQDTPGAGLATKNAPALNLVESGTSSWTIVLLDECSPQEREAAHLLSATLAQAAGVWLPMRAYGENWVGWEETDAAITALPSGPAAALSSLSSHALQEPSSWIWLPHEIDELRLEAGKR